MERIIRKKGTPFKNAVWLERWATGSLFQELETVKYTVCRIVNGHFKRTEYATFAEAEQAFNAQSV